MIGCGTRGGIVAPLLLAAGVTEIALVDGALVEQADIGAHPLQFRPDVGQTKPDALAAKLGLIDSAVLAQPFPAAVTEDNATAILTGVECAVDCVGDADVTGWLADAAAVIGIHLVTPPQWWSAEDSSRALAAGVAGMQADLALRVIGGEVAEDAPVELAAEVPA